MQKHLAQKKQGAFISSKKHGFYYFRITADKKVNVKNHNIYKGTNRRSIKQDTSKKNRLREFRSNPHASRQQLQQQSH